MKLKMRSYESLVSDGHIYKANYCEVIISNGKKPASWKAFSPDCFHKIYEIGKNLSHDTYSNYKILFYTLENSTEEYMMEETKKCKCENDKKCETECTCECNEVYNLDEVMPEKKKHPKPEKITD